MASIITYGIMSIAAWLLWLILTIILGRKFKVFKIIFTVIHIASILAALIFGYFLFQDINKFKTEFPGADKTMVIQDSDGRFLAGFSGKFTEREQPKLLAKEELTSLDINSVKSGNYLFVIKMESLASGNIEFNERVYTQKQAFDLLRSEAPQEIKSTLAVILFSKASENDPLFLFEQIKQGNIRIYPETKIFKLINLVPQSVIEGLASRAQLG